MNEDEDKKIAREALQNLVDVVDRTGEKAIVALTAIEDAGIQAAHSGVVVVDETLDTALKELNLLRVKLMGIMRAMADVATEPLP